MLGHGGPTSFAESSRELEIDASEARTDATHDVSSGFLFVASKLLCSILCVHTVFPTSFVIGLMYFNIHSGSCAPVELKLSSLATF